MRKREPFFGPNARPFFIQLAAGIALYQGLLWIGFDDLVHSISCWVWPCS